MEIRGVGPAFCEKHGRSLLAALGTLEEDRTGAHAIHGRPPEAETV